MRAADTERLAALASAAPESGRPQSFWLEASILCLTGEQIVACCLSRFWKYRACPLVAYVCTEPSHQRQRLAHGVLDRTLAALAANRFTEVRAVITEGNIASERLFLSAGFVRLTGDS